MRNTFRAIAVASAMCPALVMADGADLTIIGTIIPTSCTPSFAGGNTVNLGDIPAASLNRDRQTELTNHNVTLSVSCSASAPIAIKVHDNQAHTQLPGIVVDGSDWAMYIYGIGEVAGTKIGGYGLRFGTPTVDGETSVVMYKQGADANWYSPSPATLVGKNYESNLRYSWGRTPAARSPVDTDMNTFARNIITSSLLLCLWGGGTVRAAGMVPETPVVVLDEAVGETAINVFNSEPHPALLHTSIEDVPQDTEPLLLLTPPVTRVEPGATQRVRFILRSAEPLKTERLKRVVFEGISPQDSTGKAQVSLSVRQNIPAILRPAKLPVDREPWKHLLWSRQGAEVQVRNPSPYVVRLGHAVMLLPGQQEMDLGRTYVLPGETLTLSGTAAPAYSATQVRLYPVTTYGFAIAHHDAPLVAD